MKTFVEPASHARARWIMGTNFLGLEEVRRGYGGVYTEEQLQQLTEIPFMEETLRACKDTHVLVAGAPLSVNVIRTLAESDFFHTDWYRQEPFANDRKVTVRWYLLRKEPVPKSRSKTYDQQCSLLMEEEEVPFACEVTYVVILYWLTHGERLLPEVYVRCQDKSSHGYRVSVSLFDSDGFAIGDFWDDDRDSSLGLASTVLRRIS
jgi:hypothetical protein